MFQCCRYILSGKYRQQKGFTASYANCVPFGHVLRGSPEGNASPFGPYFVLCTLQSFADLPRGSHGPPRYQMKTWFVCCGMLSVFSYTDHGLQLQFQNVSLCRLRRLNAFLPKDPAALPDQVVHGVLVAVNKPPASGAYPEAVLQRKILVFMAATGTGFA